MSSTSTDAPTVGQAPAAPKRRFLAVKIVLGIVVLGGLVLGTGALVDALDGDETPGASPLLQGPTGPSGLDPAALSTALSSAAAGDDPAAFLALFGSDLQADAGRYFANLRTMGVDRVVAVLDTESAADVAEDTFSASLRIGLHVAGVDGNEPEPLEPAPGMALEPSRTPATDYTVTVSRTDGASGVIEAWAPVGAPAPWDVQELAAVRGPNYVLATGVQNEQQLATFSPPVAEAAEYVTTLFSAVFDALGPESGLDNPGFLLFLEPDDALYASYFVADRTAGPINESAGYAVPFSSASGASAGARVVLRPQDDTSLFASVAVHELVHVMYQSTPNNSFVGAGHSDPGIAWVAEGIAEWVQTLYGDKDFTGPTRSAVREAVTRGFFADRPPTREELYEQSQYGYPVAASVFQWISETSGEAAAFAAASANLQAGVDELFFILQSQNGGDPQADWAAWVRAL